MLSRCRTGFDRAFTCIELREENSPLKCCLVLHLHLGLQACEIAEYRSDGEHAPLAFVFQQAIFRLDIAVDRDLIPLLGVANIIDRHVVVLAPEERHRIEFLALPQHVERCGLSLALRDHPMFHADIFVGMRVGPARNIARSIDTGDARFEKGIHQDTAIEHKARPFGQRQTWPHPDTNNHEVGFKHTATFERRLVAFDGDHSIFEMEHDPVLFMQRTNEVAHFWPEDALHRPFFRRHHVYFNVACAQGCCHLKPNKACTNHECAAHSFGRVNDRATIRKRTQRVNMRLVGARDRQAHGLCAGGKQKPIVSHIVAATR